ncbi:MAG TPA: hypothetical protein VFT47_13880 [Vicinamibacterales bacterium]|nr:hypothetical protein [Vicinamibacterales bacterium]
MVRRFAAASSVASMVIAIGALASLLATRWSPADVRVLTTAWCFVPFAWGLWAALAPSRWVPQRLPLWGAILGLAAGIVPGPILDVPRRLGGLPDLRWITLIVGPIFYYLIWLFVPVTYRSLDATLNLPLGNKLGRVV